MSLHFATAPTSAICSRPSMTQPTETLEMDSNIDSCCFTYAATPWNFDDFYAVLGHSGRTGLPSPDTKPGESPHVQRASQWRLQVAGKSAICKRKDLKGMPVVTVRLNPEVAEASASATLHLTELTPSFLHICP